MLRKVRKTISDSSLLERGDHLVVAVSGGPDSVALLWTLVLLSIEYDLQLTTAHLNHGLRGVEAQREERFVRSFCAGMGIPCISKTVDVQALHRERKKSLEDVGREERYRFLDETAEACGANKIATGHQRDDQAETVLINLLRGSGLEGLKGIVPARDGRIIRPLLHVGRGEILEFLDREGLTYLTDSSNRNLRFLRNRIRHALIPELTAQYNPGIVRGLSQTAEIVRREDDFLRMTVDRLLRRWGVVPGDGEVDIPLAEFIGEHAALQGRVIKCLIEAVARKGKGVGYRHVEAVLELARSPRLRKASLDLPGLVRVAKEGNVLTIARVNSRPVRRDKGERNGLK